MEHKIHSVYPDPNQWRQLENSVFGGAGGELQRVRDYARANHVSPVAFLNAAVLYTLAATPGTVTLDAGLGPFSPNLFLCCMGSPGAGKDRLMRTTRRGITVAGGGKDLRPTDAGIGSGEGLLAALSPDGEGNAPGASVLFGVSEVGLLKQLAGRQGSTLRPHLLNVYSGNALTVNNKSERLLIPADSYRACLWVGCQPDTAGFLLEGDDDGLRHRFVFTELVDPVRTPGGEYPKTLPLHVSIPDALLHGEPMQFAEPIVRAVRDEQTMKLIYGAAPSGSGHQTQTTLKVAAGITLLHSRDSVTEGDYARACALMRYSADVAAAAEVHLFGKRVDADAERLARREAAEEQRDAKRAAKARRLVLEAVRDAGDWVPESPLRNSARRYREEFDAVVRELEMHGAIELATSEEGNRSRRFLRAGPGLEEALMHYGMS